jgi:hypothetical protein
MRRALTLVMAWITLTVCVVCPLMQAFDFWDHELQTGHDSEFVFVVLSVCIGALLVLARTALLLNIVPARELKAVLRLFLTSDSLAGVSLVAFLSTSPPPAVLRI